MSSAPQHKLEANREPAHFKLCDFVARIQDYMAQGDERSIDYLLDHFRIDDKGAISIWHREDS